MKTSRLKPMQLADISNYKNEIYGFSILWIVFFHSVSTFGIDYSFGIKYLIPIHSAISNGNIGVEIFLFCSGIFVYYSFYKNPDILLFIKKRALRLFLPVIIISGPYWVAKYIILEHDIYLFISKLTMMDFWFSGDQQIWFVTLILVCYFVYPYVHSYLFSSKFCNVFFKLLILLAITVLFTLSIRSIYPVTFNKIEIALTRFPVFFIGCFFGKFVYEKKTLPWYSYLACLALVIMTIFVLNLGKFTGVWDRWIRLFSGIPLTYLVVLVLNLLKFKPLNIFFAFFGTISLNLYVAHIIAFRIIRYHVAEKDRTILLFMLVFLVSTAVSYLAELLIKHITKKRVKG